MDLTALQSDSAPRQIDSSEEGRERLDETGQLVGAPGEIQLTHGPGYGGASLGEGGRMASQALLQNPSGVSSSLQNRGVGLSVMPASPIISPTSGVAPKNSRN